MRFYMVDPNHLGSEIGYDDGIKEIGKVDKYDSYNGRSCVKFI